MSSERSLNRISSGRNAYDKSGANLEQEFVGSLNSTKYRDEAYTALHKNEIPDDASPESRFCKIIQFKEKAQREFNDALTAFRDRKNYINFRNSMAPVERCQSGNPENPSRFFSKALYNYMRGRWEDKYNLKFFTAVGGSHLDILHKVDFFFKLYNKETSEEITYATVDITGRKAKDATRADVLLNIDPEEVDKYDPSPVNESYDEKFFNEKIAEFGEEILAAMVENYQKTLN